jgi:hypothetical protein
MAVEEAACLMSIMTMASHGRQVFHFLRVVCVGKGFEDEFSDNSDLLKSVRRVFNPNPRVRVNSMDENLM